MQQELFNTTYRLEWHNNAPRIRAYSDGSKSEVYIPILYWLGREHYEKHFPLNEEDAAELDQWFFKQDEMPF